jgi:hypothetical protein
MPEDSSQSSSSHRVTQPPRCLRCFLNGPLFNGGSANIHYLNNTKDKIVSKKLLANHSGS